MKEILTQYFTEEAIDFIIATIKNLLSIGTITAVVAFLYKYISSLVKKSRNNKDLYPFYNNKILKEVSKRYVRTKCQNLDPSNDGNLKDSYSFAVREDLLDFFLKKVFPEKNIDIKFYLILADAGMGKSTFMLNLFSKYNNFKNIVFSSTKIKLLPLGENYVTIIKAIGEIENPKNTILLLDALDESPIFITNHEINNRFHELIELVKDFKNVIITCRTHFFTNEKDEPYELKIKKFNTKGNGFHIIKKLYISPFDEKDVKNYIIKTFNIFEQQKIEAAFKIIKNANDLFIRPMLLSYIRELVNEKKDFYLTFDVYETLINVWVDREANKYPIDEREIFKFNLYLFSYEIALHIYENYEKNGLFVELDDAIKIAKMTNINLSDLEIKSRTLLNRNMQGSYKFSHKSIFEFFIAYFSFLSRKNTNKNTYILNYNLTNYDQAKKFIEELQINYKTDFRLPNYYDNIDERGNKIASQIFKQQFKTQPKMIWLTEDKYKVEDASA